MKLDKIMYPETYSDRVLFLCTRSIHDYTLISVVIDYHFLLNRRLKNPFLISGVSISVFSSLAALET